MGVAYILSQAGAKMGQNPAEESQRLNLIRFLNEAAAELYVQSDMKGSLVEQVFKVNGDQTITLPSYVGTIRAVREYASMQPWHINQMRPRYNQFNWPDQWRNWRIKNQQALQSSVINESVGVLTVSLVETPPIVVTVSGPTTTATMANETIIMDAVLKQTVNQYTDYVSVTKDRINNFDVTLSDIDGRALTVIPNNDVQAMYQIVDISTCPWLPQDTSAQSNYVEILYKKVLPYLSNDSDEFPAFNYDNVIVNKMMQLWMEEQGKVEEAGAYDSKATRSMARIHEDQNRETEDVVALVSNTHDTLLGRIGTGLRRRYGYRWGRRS